MKSVQVSFMMVAMVATLIACSAKVSTSDSGVPTIPGLGKGGGQQQGSNGQVKNVVDGPKLEGKYASDCQAWANSPGQYIKLSLEFKAGQVVIRSEDIYSDSECSNITDYREQGGTYRFLAKFDGDVYQVEYSLMTADGPQPLKENLKVADGKLYSSFRASGNGIVPDVEMHKAE